MTSSPALEPTIGCFDTNNTGHQDIKTFLELCGQLKYLETFINEGFESTAAICEVTEDDMIAMDVKRGHRRMIQRQIAATRGILPKYPLSVASETSASFYDSSTMVDNTSTSSGNGTGNGKKRKYRRHPKRDKNAPKRPPSAYIMFSNDMRKKINDKSKTFTEMAKTIGEQWKNLDPNKKQAYELEAMKSKDAYHIAMQQYRKTSDYKEYQQYLKEFKQKDKDNDAIQNKAESPSSGSMADSSSNNGTDSQQVFLVQLPNKSSSAGAGTGESDDISQQPASQQQYSKCRQRAKSDSSILNDGSSQQSNGRSPLRRSTRCRSSTTTATDEVSIVNE